MRSSLLLLFSAAYIPVQCHGQATPQSEVQPAQPVTKPKPVKRTWTRPRTQGTQRPVYVYQPPPVNPLAWTLGNLIGAAAAEGYRLQMASDRKQADTFADGPTHPEEYVQSNVSYGRVATAAPIEQPPLAPPLARFTSEPAGADVRVDGAYVGTTPTAELLVASGSHVVTMTRTGYKPWSGSLLAAPGNVNAVGGALIIETDPSKPKISGY